MLATLKNRLQRLFANKWLGRVVTLEVIALAWILSGQLPGGYDLFTWYYHTAWGCVECNFMPWHATWVLFPLRFVPTEIAWPLMMTITLVVAWWIAEQNRVNVITVMVSFPLIAVLWLGQVDWLIMLGLALAFFAPSPWLRGVGIVLASLKPQISLAAIPVAIWLDKDRWRTLIVPAAVAAATVIVWGIDWPLRWWSLHEAKFTQTLWIAAPLPYNPLPYLAIGLVKEKREKLVVSLLAAALTIPTFRVYSYIDFLVFFAPWWAALLSYAWVLGYPIWGAFALNNAWILPVALMLTLIWPGLKERWQAFQAWRAAPKASPPAEPLSKEP